MTIYIMAMLWLFIGVSGVIIVHESKDVPDNIAKDISQSEPSPQCANCLSCNFSVLLKRFFCLSPISSPLILFYYIQVSYKSAASSIEASQLAWEATKREVEMIMNSISSSAQPNRESHLLTANNHLKQWFDAYEAIKTVVVTENESAASIIRARRVASSRGSLMSSQTGAHSLRLHPSNKAVLEALRLKADLLILIGPAYHNEVCY
jgi:hypothetical protein